jgi:hypothetical protein
MKGDHVHVCGGHSVAIRPEGPRSTGRVYSMRQGQPIPPGAELLRHLGGDCYESLGPLDGQSSGPLQVASPAYREGYDRIFGRKPTVGYA